MRWAGSGATNSGRSEPLAGEAALAKGKDGSDARDQEIKELKAEVEELTLTVGEFAAANRILKKLSGQSD